MFACSISPEASVYDRHYQQFFDVTQWCCGNTVISLNTGALHL